MKEGGDSLGTKGCTILQILPDLNSGGVERGTLEIAQALHAAGFRSLVISGGGPMVAQLESQGSRHYSMPIGVKSLRTLAQVRPLRRFLREHSVDLVHVRSRLPAWILHLALRGMPAEERPRTVSTVHGLYSVSRYSAIMTRWERVIAVSETVRRYILEHYPQCPESRIRVIPRGVDPALFPHGYKPEKQWLERFLDQFPQTKGKRILVLPGRLTRLKGHHDFLRLLQQLAGESLPVHGLIVGGEDPRRLGYARELREKVRELGLEETVTFTGSRSDIREFYAVADLVLSLSRKPESFGRTVLEALMMGVPVVGYDHGGVGEVMGRLFPQGRVPLGDQERLLETCRRLLAEPMVVPPVEGYRREEMLKQTLDLYRELIRLKAGE